MASAHRASIDDVAALAKVSTATVSRALRGMSNVAPATRAAVETAAKQLGYQADPSASRLASGRTATVGVIAPYFGTWYASNVLLGIEAHLRASQYDMLLSTINRATGPSEFARRLSGLARRVDGIITVDLYPSSPGRSELERLPIPLVTIGDRIEGRSYSGLDNDAVGSTATRHLLELGHRDIALVRGYESGSPVEDTREAAWRRELDQSRLTSGPDRVVIGEMSAAGGLAALDQMLSWPKPPTAVFCISDEIAFGVLAGMAERGMRAPDDLAVVGVDDHELSAALGVTSMRQGVEEAGHWAATTLLATIDESAAATVERVEVPKLIVRGSTVRPS